jgi:hypothetical protein
MNRRSSGAALGWTTNKTGRRGGSFCLRGWWIAVADHHSLGAWSVKIGGNIQVLSIGAGSKYNVCNGLGRGREGSAAGDFGGLGWKN